MTTFDVSTRVEFALTAQVIGALLPRARECGARLLLVGAAARDLVVTARTGGLPARRTNDVDIAVAVDGWDGFRCVTSSLTPVPRQAQRFLLEGIQVDVVPFGGVEGPDGTIRWADDHEMSVIGFDEALATAIDVVLPGAVVAAVADLPAQVALKLMAWRDRGRVDNRDAVDLLTLVQSFAEGEYHERLYAEHGDALVRQDFDPALAAADALGTEIAAMLKKRSLGAVVALLERECGDEGRLPAEMGALVARNRLLLVALREGLRHPRRRDS